MVTCGQILFTTFLAMITAVTTMTIMNDVTDHAALRRERRSMIFPPGAVLQFSIGVSNPVTGLPNIRTLVLSYGLQMVFNLPTNSTQWRNPAVIAKKREVSKRAILDTYLPLEEFLDDQGFNGRTCLLRSICEAAHSPFHHEDMGLLEEMAHALLTPSQDILPEDANCTDNSFILDYLPLEMHYLAAECLGKSDGDCLAAYPECPKLPLDYFSQKIYDETPYE